MSTIPDRHPHPSRLLRHVDDTSVLTKLSFPSVFAGRDAYAGATLARYVSQLVPSKIPTRQWSLRGRAAWATCDPGGARSTAGVRYERRVEHVVGVKRAVHALERGHAPRLSPDCPRPLGHRLTFKRSTLRCPFEYPLTLFPPDWTGASTPTDVIALAQAQLAAATVRPLPMQTRPPRRLAARDDPRATIHAHNRATPG